MYLFQLYKKTQVPISYKGIIYQEILGPLERLSFHNPL